MEEKHLYAKSHFLDEIAVGLGGYAAEIMVFKELTTGASNDLMHATNVARSMITRYGMSDKIGPVALDEHNEMVFLGKEFGGGQNYSEETAKLIDSEVSKIMYGALKRANEVLAKHRKTLDKIADTLIKKETLEREEYDKILVVAGIPLKKLVG